MTAIHKRNRWLHVPPGLPLTPFDGKQATLVELARFAGISKNLLRDRLARGWGVKAAITTPARAYHGKKHGDMG